MLQIQKLCVLLIFSFLIFSNCANAQEDTRTEPVATLHIGDDAPAFHGAQWLKGKPIKKLKKGKLYVVEFWATWCGPCKLAMPHLSQLAAKYKDKISFIGIDVWEKKTTPIEKIKHFVDSMGQKMDYTVATDDNDFMLKNWLDALGGRGVPQSFVINEDGKIAWVGHPGYLPGILAKVTSNEWNIENALADYNEETRLTKLDNEAYFDLLNYVKLANWASSKDKPDSLLLAVEAIVEKEPKLKYAPIIAGNTFRALLKTDMHKAFLYGEEAIKIKFFDYPISYYIKNEIEFLADSLPLTPEIFQLGIEACQAEINEIFYPEAPGTHKVYSCMANWYWRINDLAKAIETQEKAIADIKSKTSYAADELTSMEAQLEKYRRH
ncbi:MAG: TlpA disulfide reductase family protein [Chitinophagaceae bacterium]